MRIEKREVFVVVEGKSLKVREGGRSGRRGIPSFTYNFRVNLKLSVKDQV